MSNTGGVAEYDEPVYVVVCCGVVVLARWSSISKWSDDDTLMIVLG